MAVQDAKNFLDAVDHDPKLRKKVRGAFHQIVETAQKNGYDISARELAAELHRRWGLNPPQDSDPEPDSFCIG